MELTAGRAEAGRNPDVIAELRHENLRRHFDVRAANHATTLNCTTWSDASPVHSACSNEQAAVYF
jgi:hypothetical protein